MQIFRSSHLLMLFRTLFVVCLVTLLVIDVFVLHNNNENNIKTKEEITKAMTTKNKAIIIHAKEIQQNLEDGSRNDDLSYIASKRKVPRGSDPIHNRRAGNSRRPPGRA
ncbi:unnamed protein product [Cochlearia groenlandica]